MHENGRSKRTRHDSTTANTQPTWWDWAHIKIRNRESEKKDVRTVHSDDDFSDLEHHWAVGCPGVSYFSWRSNSSYHRSSRRHWALGQPCAGDCSRHSRPRSQPIDVVRIRNRATTETSSECSIVSCHNTRRQPLPHSFLPAKPLLLSQH